MIIENKACAHIWIQAIRGVCEAPAYRGAASHQEESEIHLRWRGRKPSQDPFSKRSYDKNSFHIVQHPGRCDGQTVHMHLNSLTHGHMAFRTRLRDEELQGCFVGGCLFRDRAAGDDEGLHLVCIQYERMLWEDDSAREGFIFYVALVDLSSSEMGSTYV